MEEKIPVVGLTQAEISAKARLLSETVGERLSDEILASLANILGATGEAGLSAVHEYLDEGI
jgi:hypothetical protein